MIDAFGINKASTELERQKNPLHVLTYKTPIDHQLKQGSPPVEEPRRTSPPPPKAKPYDIHNIFNWDSGTEKPKFIFAEPKKEKRLRKKKHSKKTSKAKVHGFKPSRRTGLIAAGIAAPVVAGGAVATAAAANHRHRKVEL